MIDTGQQIPNFDRCQLTIKWMCNDKAVMLLTKGSMSYKQECGLHVVRRRYCRRAYVPMTNTAGLFTMRKAIHRFL